MSNKPVVIEFKRDRDGYGKGERFVVASFAKAEELYPGAMVVSYEDGTPFEKPKPSAPAAGVDTKVAEPAAAHALKATDPAKIEAEVVNS
ncbi:MAG: hypothetical protein WKF63_08350 [Thermomicrobiales bacterium]